MCLPNTPVTIARPSKEVLGLNVTGTLAGGADGARETASERPRRWMSVCMPAELRDAVEAKAARDRSSLSLVIRNALNEHVELDERPPNDRA